MEKQCLDYRDTIDIFDEKNSIYFPSIDGYEFCDRKLRLEMQDDTKIPLVLIACGSFSPITYLHLRMFEMASDVACKKWGMEVLGGYYSPVADDYKKEGLLESKDRLQMCKLACEETSSWLMIDAWEALQKRHTRTAIVLDHFNYEINKIRGGVFIKTGEKKKVKIMLLIGSDLLQSMMTQPVWEERDLHHIFKYYGCFVIERGEIDVLSEISKHNILSMYQNNIIVVKQWIYNDISSTKIRFCIRNGLSIKYLLPDSVLQYIYQNKLYLA
ncbi:nicotinate (nicotinamide) nucleotide adenylyltransferase [Pneumocystis murina B123]|uniref:Nicotinamide-nucleotide adenylyltransferase n=1 Tax=Pneumocystis murina (strain B123) TaxID=1069680 RepID=M7P5H1_PNEMU|nr:nicotinate (nicotinamide) nucleotide adenylyltransferase [Pneumocystis murina B123]EMR09130.1 nicotinate (nicotinamide) nucleotide adenylyltransferase [Pneumocystis murina B123]